MAFLFPDRCGKCDNTLAFTFITTELIRTETTTQNIYIWRCKECGSQIDIEGAVRKKLNELQTMQAENGRENQLS